jgi:hypothetical protein
LFQSSVPHSQLYGLQSFHSQSGLRSFNHSSDGHFLHDSERNSGSLASPFVPFGSNWPHGNTNSLPTGYVNPGILCDSGSYESFIGDDFQSSIQTDNLISSNVNINEHTGYAVPDALIGTGLPGVEYPPLSNGSVFPFQEPYPLDDFMDSHSGSTFFTPPFNDDMNVQYASQEAITHQQMALIPPPNLTAGYACTYPNCFRVFRRDADRLRHATTAHNANNVGVHLCPVVGCVKSQGAGYSRADKVKEHLWKKHANLGYVKGRM